MATVYVKNIVAFDATKEQIITFGYDGNQCTKNRIIVYNSATNASVYDDTVTVQTLEHTIPANTLTNGTSYYCTITAYYTSGGIEYNVTSSPSNIWKCLATATWSINGLSEGTIIGNSYYTFMMSYSQANGETVNEFYIVLYNQSGTAYWSSDALYDISVPVTASNLPNNTVLYARAYGSTINGLQLDTGKISVTVDYTVPDLYSNAYLENDKWHGWVKVTTNVLDIEGVGVGNYSFTGDTYIDLSASGSSVEFGNNFNVNKNFIIESLFYGASTNKTIMTLSGEGLSIPITTRSGTFASGNLFFIELKDTVSGYVLYSNMINIPSLSDHIHLWVQRYGGIYNCIIKNMGA